MPVLIMVGLASACTKMVANVAPDAAINFQSFFAVRPNSKTETIPWEFYWVLLQQFHNPELSGKKTSSKTHV